MKRATIFLLTIIGIMHPAPTRLGAESGPSIWYVDSLIKVFPTDTVESHTVANPELLAARGQHVSVQLVVRSTEPLGGVTAEVVPLKNDRGGSLAGGSVRPVGYVVVGSHTGKTPEDELVGEVPGWFPDPLLDFPLDVPANRTQSLWVSVAVPADAQPGDYHGAVVLRAGNQEVARRKLRVKVLPAGVPARRTLKVTNWFSFDDKTSRQFYDVRQFTPEWWTLIGNIARVMAEHRQNMVITPLMDLIQPRANGDRLAYDFANFDRWVETFKDAGVIGYIEGSHLLGRGDSYDSGLTVSTFQIENGKVTRPTLGPDDPRVEPFLARFLTALNSHLEAKGWKSIYYQHILDEAHGPEPPYYAQFAELVHRYLPGIPTMDAVDAQHMPAELQKNCDIWVPLLGRFDDQMELIRQRLASGHEVWFYTCLFPAQRYPNRLIDFPLLKVRLLHWLNYRYGFTGFLHWGWSYWTPDPILDTQPVINANTQILPAGDAFIVYPDRARMSVHSSIRLETMLQGIEDYEMLRALQATNPEEADRLGKEAMAGFTDYVRDPVRFREIEKQLLEALSK